VKVRELIKALRKCDPELQVAYPISFHGRDDYPKVVATVVTTTENAYLGVSLIRRFDVRCVMLNPTFAQLDRSEECQAQDRERAARKKKQT
jgi:hypothetical protein